MSFFSLPITYKCGQAKANMVEKKHDNSLTYRFQTQSFYANIKFHVLTRKLNTQESKHKLNNSNIYSNIKIYSNMSYARKYNFEFSQYPQWDLWENYIQEDRVRISQRNSQSPSSVVSTLGLLDFRVRGPRFSFWQGRVLV